MSLNTQIDALYDLVKDYGADDPFQYRKISKASILRWVEQFPAAARVPLLEELTHIFSKIYLSKGDVEYYLECILGIESLISRTDGYWERVELLNIQGGGRSQTTLNRILCNVALEKLHIDIGSKPDGVHFLHLDDCLYSGSRVSTDMINWINEDAPQYAIVDIVFFATHAHGRWQAGERIKEAIAASGKTISVTWREACVFENRKRYLSEIDTLRPFQIPQDPNTLAYAAQAQARGDLCLRPRACLGKTGLYSSLGAREVLERELLIAGVQVKQICQNLYDAHKPLGFWSMPGLGFGTLFVTYLNCPNNAPLALWVSEPWFPLFRRRTN